MSSQVCSKCRRIIGSGDVFYSVKIDVSAGFDGVINIKGEKIDLTEEFEKVKSYPEELLNEEVFKEFNFILCPRCKEIYCANPMNLPLGDPTQGN